MNREQIERAEAVAAKADRERKRRRDRREDVLVLSETQGWKKPASLATGVRPVKRARSEHTVYGCTVGDCVAVFGAS
jgi:hypothetical protein